MCSRPTIWDWDNLIEKKSEEDHEIQYSTNPMLKIEIENEYIHIYIYIYIYIIFKKDQSHPRLIFQTHDLGYEVRITS